MPVSQELIFCCSWEEERSRKSFWIYWVIHWACNEWVLSQVYIDYE